MRQIKINAITYAQLIKSMLPGDLNCRELAEETGLHYVTVLQYTRELHRAKAAHIARYELDSRSYPTIKVYCLGPGKDASRGSRTPAQRSADYKARKSMATLLGVAA